LSICQGFGRKDLNALTQKDVLANIEHEQVQGKDRSPAVWVLILMVALEFALINL
jgi:hypothetical protein